MSADKGQIIKQRSFSYVPVHREKLYEQGSFCQPLREQEVKHLQGT